MSRAGGKWLLAASAIEDFKLDELRALLKEHPSLALEKDHENGDTLLQWAIMLKNVEAAKALLPMGCVNQGDDDGDTPMMRACLLAQPEMQEIFVEELLRWEPDLMAQNNRGRTALSYAILEGNLATVRMVIAAREAVKESVPVDGFSPLDVDEFGQNLAHFAAASHGDGYDCLDFILALPGGKAMASAKDHEGHTPETLLALLNKPNRSAYWRAKREQEELLKNTPAGIQGAPLRM